MSTTLLHRAGSRALLTDMYQLTMAYGYWKAGMADREAVYHLFFRENPFRGGFTLACGLSDCVKYMVGFHFGENDRAYLAALTGSDGKPLFEERFIEYLGDIRMRLDVEAVPEGSVIFPNEPVLRVRGPILQAQIVESALLNIMNFQSLIATKAARICLAAQGDQVVEFGLRRAQGIDGALTASRAAYVGGCSATSNLMAGKLFGIPVRGTQAHSWILSFDDEQSAFNAYADALPNNAFFLVDTYSTVDGVRRAVEAGKRLLKSGRRLGGIRLDSGDLALLSVEARRILDGAGFQDALILASNDLDEYAIAALKEKKAAVQIWGVGTRLVTAYDQPALGGVYKLSAVRKVDGRWDHKLKLSDQPAKINNPGMLQVRRFHNEKEFTGDAIYDELGQAPEPFTIVDPVDGTKRKIIPPEMKWDDLLTPMLSRGQPVKEQPSLDSIRERVQRQLAMLPAGVKRIENPQPYLAGLELGTHELKKRLTLAVKTAARARPVNVFKTFQTTDQNR
jgi:nicotinate phosphoribosyltransferase